MPKWHFLVVLDSDMYQSLGITMFLRSQHVLNFGCVVYTHCPVSACSCIGHASHMHTKFTFAAHTVTLDMFCIHSCYLHLFRHFSTYNMFLYLCHALVYTLFHHLQHVMFTLCFIFLSFILASFSHSSCTSHASSFTPVHTFFFPSFLLIHLSIRDKKGESTLESILECIIISI